MHFYVVYRLHAAEKFQQVALLLLPRLDVIVSLLHLHLSGSNGQLGDGVGAGREKVLYDDFHVMVYHAAKNTTIQGIQIIQCHVLTGFMFGIQSQKSRHVFVVNIIPIGLVHIPKHIACADALP